MLGDLLCILPFFLICNIIMFSRLFLFFLELLVLFFFSVLLALKYAHSVQYSTFLGSISESLCTRTD